MSNALEFMRVINFAVELGLEAQHFLEAWREGNWEACKGFGWTPEPLVQHRIHAHISYIECPYCKEYLEGFLGDPRGVEVVCEDCGESFLIADDSEVALS